MASANPAAGGGSFTDDHGAARYTVVSLPAVTVSPLNCAGPNACEIVSVYTTIFWIAMAVLVIVGGLIVYAALRFRRTDDREPAQVHGNPRLEILWTAVPVLIVSFVFIRTTLRMDYVRNGPPPQLTIQVTGVQYAWSFKYPNGKASFTTLTIPTGQVVRLEVTSRDVLHSFWVPRLGGQIYAKPGFPNSGWIEASQPGKYYGQCNELCGIGHSTMLLEVDAVTVDQYQAFLSGTAPPGGGAVAQKVSGVPASVNVGQTDELKFVPASATAKVGDVIQWKNQGTALHNVVFDNQAVPSSDPMNQGDTFEIKFTQAGTYTYVCKFHEAQNMRGTITVSP
jgi:cytochrome c oxidase subunit II